MTELLINVHPCLALPRTSVVGNFHAHLFPLARECTSDSVPVGLCDVLLLSGTAVAISFESQIIHIIKMF